MIRTDWNDGNQSEDVVVVEGRNDFHFSFEVFNRWRSRLAPIVVFQYLDGDVDRLLLLIGTVKLTCVMRQLQNVNFRCEANYYRLLARSSSDVWRSLRGCAHMHQNRQTIINYLRMCEISKAIDQDETNKVTVGIIIENSKLLSETTFNSMRYAVSSDSNFSLSQLYVALSIERQTVLSDVK